MYVDKYNEIANKTKEKKNRRIEDGERFRVFYCGKDFHSLRLSIASIITQKYLYNIRYLTI